MTTIKIVYKRIRDILLCLLLFLSAISYHPTLVRISRLAGYESGSVLSRYILLLFFLVFVMSVSIITLRQSKLVRKCIIWIGIIAFFALFIMTFFYNRGMISDLRTLTMVLGSIMIGYDYWEDDKGFFVLLIVFSLTTVYSGLMQVLVNIGGFRIANVYLADSKNSLGALLATSTFSLFYLYLVLEKRWQRNTALVLAFLSFVLVVTIRARMAVVALFMVGMYYFYLLDRGRNLTRIIIIGFLFLIVSLSVPSIFSYLERSFSSGTQAEDFTSGRIDTYLDALSYLSTHPMLGNIRGLNHISWVHNYILLKLYHYGFLFFWPLIVYYFIILFVSLTRSFRCNNAYSRECFCYVCLLIPFLISLAEPTFPFGPGTVTLYNFVLLGIAEKRHTTST